MTKVVRLALVGLLAVLVLAAARGAAQAQAQPTLDRCLVGTWLYEGSYSGGSIIGTLTLTIDAQGAASLVYDFNSPPGNTITSISGAVNGIIVTSPSPSTPLSPDGELQWGGPIVSDAYAYVITIEPPSSSKFPIEPNSLTDTSYTCTTQELTGPPHANRPGLALPVDDPNLGFGFVRTSPPPTAVNLDVRAEGGGQGTVVSSPAGIDCSSNCTASFWPATPVTLTAEPAPGSVFTGWSGACSGVGRTCDVDMLNDESVSATFEQTHKLTLAAAGPGLGSVTPNPYGSACGSGCWDYTQGAYVTLTANEPVGSEFIGWSSGPCAGSSEPRCSIQMNADLTVTATFGHTLSVTLQGSGVGVVQSSPPGIHCPYDCSQKFAQPVVELIAKAAAEKSTFMGWGGACAGTGPCTVTMGGERKVTARFEPTYTLAYSTFGTGKGTVNVTGNCRPSCPEYPRGRVVTLTARVATFSKAKFVRWTVWGGSGCPEPTSLTCRLTMDTDKVVWAEFASTSFSQLLSETVREETDIKHVLREVAREFATEKWFLPYLEHVLQQDLGQPHPALALLIVKRLGAGKVTAAKITCGKTCSAWLPHGTAVTLTATPAIGSTFTGWQGACKGTRRQCRVTMSRDQFVMATFGHTLTVRTAGSRQGTVTSSPMGIACGLACSASFAQGTVVTLKAKPALGSTFEGWSGACTGLTAWCQVTISATESVMATFTASPTPSHTARSL
jgi:hypothetical protein